MASKWILVVCLAGLLAASLVPLTYSVMASRGRLNNWLTVEEVETRIRGDLPLGSTRAMVERYLTESHVEHGYDDRQNIIRAAVRNIRGGRLLLDKDALLVIKFDPAGTLRVIEVAPAFTGL